jgi:DNA-binding Xre family transcriptional regulator
MYDTQQVDKHLIERLEQYYPFIARTAVEYIQVGPMELMVNLDDGSTVLYDDIDQSFRNLPRDSRHMSEQQCRQEFSIRLRRLMYRQGITQKELAEETGISEITISNYITGKRTPSFYNVDKISKALKCSIDLFRYF